MKTFISVSFPLLKVMILLGLTGFCVAATCKPKLLERNQPILKRIFAWDGKTVVEVEEKPCLRILNIASGKVSALTIPGAEEVLAVATQGATPLTLIRIRGEVKLQSGKTTEPVPESLRNSRRQLMLTAGGSAAVVLENGTAKFWREGSVWKPLALHPFDVKYQPDFISGAAVLGHVVYISYDVGEWGGGLLAVDLDAGTWSAPIPISGRTLPVHTIESRDGKLWVLEGQTHLGIREGRLRTLSSGKWETLADITDIPKKRRLNWPFKITSFEGFSFDSAGCPNVLTPLQGIVCLAEGKWKRVTTGWKYDLETLNVGLHALHIEGDIAVIGTYDAGIILWNLRTDDVRMVALK